MMGYHVQLVPIQGILLGGLYYSPEDDETVEIDEEDVYYTFTICLIFFGIHFTWWKMY